VQNFGQGTLCGVPLYKHSVYTDNARNQCDGIFYCCCFFETNLL